MKTAAILSTLALASASTHAALTPYNTTYDQFISDIQQIYGSLGEVVLAKPNAWLIQSFNQIATEVDASLAAGQQKFKYYSDRMDTFFADAAKHDAKFASLPDDCDKFGFAYTSPFAYAPRSYCDATFDMVESILPALNNKTLSDWHKAERKAFKSLLERNANAAFVAAKMAAYLNTLSQNEAAGAAFDKANDALTKATNEAYGIPSFGKK